MKIFHTRLWHLPLLLSFILMAWARAGSSSGIPTMPGATTLPVMDFPALIGDKGCMVHMDAQGKTTVEEIDFLKGEKIANWDFVTLNQIVTINTGNGYIGRNQTVEIKYYKDKKYVRSFRLEKVVAIAWMMIVPEKNCLIIAVTWPTEISTDTISRVRIDLTTGTRTGVDADRFPGILCKPLWDKAKGNLIVYVREDITKHKLDSLARMDPDDLSIKDNVGPHNLMRDDVEVDGLISYDSISNQVICYGKLGGPIASSKRPNFFSLSLATGQATMIMKDDLPGIFLYPHNGMATLAGQYVLMTRTGGYMGENSHSYCVDLKNLTWRALTDITPFTWPISQDGLYVQPAAAVPSASNSSATTTTLESAKSN